MVIGFIRMFIHENIFLQQLSIIPSSCYFIVISVVKLFKVHAGPFLLLLFSFQYKFSSLPADKWHI